MASEYKKDDVTIVSDDAVPPSMVQAFCGYLRQYPGSWRVRLNQRLAGGWWSVTVSAEGFHRIFLLRPDEQTADNVMRQLRGSLTPSSGGEAAPPAPWDGRERRSHPRG